MKNIYVKTIVCLTFLMGVVAQAQTVSGLVTSDDGPLPGATIVVKGTNNGTTADFDGNFSISAGADDVLVVSFVGFTTQEVAVGNQDQIRFGQYVAGSDSGRGTTVSPAYKT